MEHFRLKQSQPTLGLVLLMFKNSQIHQQAPVVKILKQNKDSDNIRVSFFAFRPSPF
jgi:hypothetical protein